MNFELGMAKELDDAKHIQPHDTLPSFGLLRSDLLHSNSGTAQNRGLPIQKAVHDPNTNKEGAAG